MVAGFRTKKQTGSLTFLTRAATGQSDENQQNFFTFKVSNQFHVKVKILQCIFCHGGILCMIELY